MQRTQSGLAFKFMTLVFKIRDLLYPRAAVLEEAGIEVGFRVLDYGCGPGSYIAPLADLVGESGEVYALDVHPLAVEGIERIAVERGLHNVKTVHSGCGTGLPDDSLDVVLLYDVFHDLSSPDDVLTELHRVLKPGGVLSFSDHHMKEEEILSRVTSGGLFDLARKGRKTFTFAKQVSSPSPCSGDSSI